MAKIVKSGPFPHAERAAAATLALPIYRELADEQLRSVVGTMNEALEQGAQA